MNKSDGQQAKPRGRYWEIKLKRHRQWKHKYEGSCRRNRKVSQGCRRQRLDGVTDAIQFDEKGDIPNRT
ncbi:hypothetical protein VSR68_09895 [Paraburkholderia phymatum]|uniref:hypothetical protein n=1 Tax=Paraburkholderia phymatum TaxID=148447 RepID=UPI0031797063